MRLKFKPALVCGLCVSAFFSTTVFAQSRSQKADPKPTPPPVTTAEQSDFDSIRQEGMDLANKGQMIKALPLLEKAAPKYPDDAELQANYGIAILVDGLTSKDPAVREKVKQKAFIVLKRAKELGTRNQIALYYWDAMQNPNTNLDLLNSQSNKVAAQFEHFQV